MTAIEDRVTAVLREELSLGDFDGDQLYEGVIDPRELAAAVVAELQLREEWTLYMLAGAVQVFRSREAADKHFRGSHKTLKERGDGPLASRVVSGWEKAE